MTRTFAPIPARRRHTLAFLRSIRSAAPVYLDTDVDVSALVAHRASSSKRYSYVTYVLAALGETLRKHPEANVCVGGPWFAPKLAKQTAVDVKLALDKTDEGVRHVASAVIADVAALRLEEIQDEVDRLRDTPAAELEELSGSRALDRLPPLLGSVAFSFATRLPTRARVLGTVAVSSLGHADVRGFYSDGGTVLTIGLGAIRHRPVSVPDGPGKHTVESRPVLPLSLTFDHRALDGAAAAEVLSTLAKTLRDGAAR
ncbi:catalytic domain of components of various dehydrogenase complexes [Segniliparus rotundus DSM 44985]|uniref:Catalytic domain of components of various dehydrogenase complexes n=1 Tax=Segniliparus rotundus (strain ATCC BAA-972 / CDC 1076 / CIP 108378 / DSM 44985 / JCM 13578) TaxID=640132 RepID=D6ZEG5_SEGRD|nr:2-oxo acid dehydrogenase subunit E2 [Segniliparus rotundus]ADG99441.1 catalytic domain of components of various dehydrogenase complexes [Segniliparus rotundus DSM 44985]